MRKFSSVLVYAVPQWRAFVAIALMTVAAAAVTALQPWPLKILIDFAFGDAAPPPPIAPALATLGFASTAAMFIVVAAAASLALFAANAALQVSLNWIWESRGQRMIYDLAADLFSRLQRLSPAFHDRKPVGDALNRLSTDIWCVYTIPQALVIGPLQNIAVLLAVGWMAWRLDPGLTVILLALAPPLAACAYVFGRRLRGTARRHQETRSNLTAFVHQTLTAIPIVQAFGSEPRNRERFVALSNDAVGQQQRHVLVTGIYGLASGLTSAIGVAVVVYLGGQRVLSGGLSLGSLLVLVAYLQSMQSAAQGLLRSYGELKTAEASLDRVLDILDYEDPVRDTHHPDRVPSPVKGRPFGSLRFEDVTFGYKTGRPVLHDIDLEVPAGAMLALVGHTGAGKSTVAALIPRFYDPWRGRVAFEGRDIRDFRLADLRAQIAIVPQEPMLLPLTVAENIAFGRPGAGRGEIEMAAEAASAADFIESLPMGYDTVLGERGVNLSGGQRQRLAIARALLKDAPVLILDEPTSALDPATEAQILIALRRLTASRTTIAIAHRLSTLRAADRIVVLDHGAVVEAGRHPDLLALGGAYRRMQDLQVGLSHEVVP